MQPHNRPVPDFMLTFTLACKELLRAPFYDLDPNKLSGLDLCHDMFIYIFHYTIIIILAVYDGPLRSCRRWIADHAVSIYAKHGGTVNLQQIIHTQSRKSEQDKMPTPVLDRHLSFGPRQENLVLIV